jgi:hypothetical protein
MPNEIFPFASGNFHADAGAVGVMFPLLAIYCRRA